MGVNGSIPGGVEPRSAGVPLMKLYIGNKNYSSWSMRPWVLMTELGMEFEEVMVPFDF